MATERGAGNSEIPQAQGGLRTIERDLSRQDLGQNLSTVLGDPGNEERDRRGMSPLNWEKSSSGQGES